MPAFFVGEGKEIGGRTDATSSVLEFLSGHVVLQE